MTVWGELVSDMVTQSQALDYPVPQPWSLTPVALRAHPVLPFQPYPSFLPHTSPTAPHLCPVGAQGVPSGLGNVVDPSALRETYPAKAP